MRFSMTLALLLASLPAQAQLQFDSNPANASPQAMTPGIQWLQRTPASLFDLGMMELTTAANKTAEALFDVNGAVAEYQAEKGLIAISFYARTAYSEENCSFVVTKLRDSMFPQRSDAAQLGNDLSSYFTTYGASQPDRPATIGAELVKVLRFAVYMPGGVCQLPLYGTDEVSFWKDPNAPLPQMPALTPPGPTPPAAPQRQAR